MNHQGTVALFRKQMVPTGMGLDSPPSYFLINRCMKYIVYRTTNKINGKIYIGCHFFREKGDQYLGSGTALRRAIKKYGRENFSREILHVCGSKEEAYKLEADLVNENFVKSRTTYNIKLGGRGGWDHIKTEAHREEGRRKLRWLFATDPSWRQAFCESNRRGQLNSYRIENRKNGFSGKRHTEATKQKVREKNSILLRGSNNPQFGKPVSEERKEKIRQALLRKEYIVCPHCGHKNNSPGAMKRWHLENCKQRKEGWQRG